MELGGFYFPNNLKTYDEYRIFTIDDSDNAVEHNKNNTTKFGLKTNTHHLTFTIN